MEIFLMLIILSSVYCNNVQSYRKSIEGYIVGGSNTTIKDYPHSAFLDIECYGHWICGSAILNQKILLTAAHCVALCDFSEEDVIYAMAGHEHLNKVTIKRKVDNVIVHEDYDTETVLNDIALASLESALPLTETTKRIIIPLQFPNVKRLWVAGWGITNEQTNETSLILKSVPQKIRSNNICNLINAARPGMFCAGRYSGGEDYPAGGDSGSALVTEDGQILGLVSYRMDNIPSLLAYTNITYFYSWIEYHTHLLFCSSTNVKCTCE